MRKLQRKAQLKKATALLVALLLAAAMIPVSAIATLSAADDEDALEVSDTLMTLATDEAAAAADELVEADSSQAVIEASVALSGRTLAAHQFSFTLTEVSVEASDGTVTASNTVKRETTNDELLAEDDEATGSIAFPKIIYDVDDVGSIFTYAISQVDEGTGGYTYDATAYTVKVAVTQDADGDVVATKTYYAADGTTVLSGAPTFNNTYSASSTLTLTAWVEFENGALTADAFEFTLAAVSGTDAEGAAIDAASVPVPASSTTTNTAAGAVLFPIAYTQADAGCTYTYTLTQKDLDNSAIASYDTSTYTYTVTVVDDGDGTLSFEQVAVNAATAEEAADAEPVFTNVSESGVLTVTKVVEGSAPADATFTFTVTLSGPYIESDETYDYTVSGGTATSGDDDADDSDDDADASASGASLSAQVVVESLRLSSASAALSALVIGDDDTESGLSAAADDETTYELDTAYTCGGCTWKVESGIDSDGNATYTLHIYPTNGTSGTLESLKESTASGGVFQPWSDYASLITDVQIDEGVTAGQGVAYMFAACTALESIDLTNLTITSSTEDFAYMFYYCTSLTSVTGLGGWDTSGAEHMDYMFLDCLELTSIDGITNWDVSGVENFSYMFHGCVSLTSLDLSGWTMNTSTTDDVSDVNMQHMFSSYIAGSSGSTSSSDGTVNVYDRGTMALTSVTLPEGFVTAAANNISYMFAGCSYLTSISAVSSDGTTATSAAASWDTSNVENFDYVFYECSSLAELDVSGWDTSSGTTMAHLFSDCSSLTTLEVGHFVMTSVTDAYYMFYGCSGLAEIDVAHKTYTDDTGATVECWNTGSLVNMYNMFQRCSIVQKLDVSEWDTSKVVQMHAAFADCYKLAELDVSEWDTSSTTYMDRVFRNCRVLVTIDISGWDTSKVERMYQLFQNCYVVTELDVSGWDTANVQSMYQLFQNCYAITELDLSCWDTGAVTGTNSTSSTGSTSYGGMGAMFDGCTSLQVVRLGDDWSFYGSGTSCSPAYLPTPTNTSGMWVRTDTTYGPYTPEALTDEAWGIDGTSSQMAGTWVWYYPAGSYQVRYDANTTDAYEGSAATQTVGLDESSITVTTTVLYRSGYAFAGWNTAADGSGTAVSAGATYAVASNNDGTATITWASGEDAAATASVSDGATVVLYAQWKASDASAEGTYTVTFTLTAGQTATFDDLPDGTTYTVEEATPGAGWTLMSSSGTSGTIAATATSQATFTNSYDPGDATAELSALVYLDDVLAASGAFAFVLSECDAAGTIGSTLQSVGNAASGAVSFDALSYTSYSDVGTHYYAITETAGDDESISYDSHTVYVKVVVADTGAQLSTAVSYSDEPWDTDPGTATAAFYNYTKGSLVVAKAVTGTDAADKAFTFAVTLTDGDGAALSCVAYTVTGADGGTVSSGTLDSGGTVTLCAGQQVRFANLGAGTAYTVSEASLPDGYTVGAIASSDSTDTVVLAADGSAGSCSGTISWNTANTVTVTNAYAASGAWTPAATLTLEGGINLIEGLFSFAVTDADGATVATGTNEAGAYSDEAGSASASVTFGDAGVTYTLDDVGTHIYTIVQTTTSFGDYTCDETVWSVTVTVSDNGDGTLSVTAVYSNGDDVTAGTSADFVNTYYHVVSLPESGAGGIVQVFLAGAALVLAGAAAALLHARRKRTA